KRRPPRSRSCASGPTKGTVAGSAAMSGVRPGRWAMENSGGRQVAVTPVSDVKKRRAQGPGAWFGNPAPRGSRATVSSSDSVPGAIAQQAEDGDKQSAAQQSRDAHAYQQVRRKAACAVHSGASCFIDIFHIVFQPRRACSQPSQGEATD